MGRGTSPTGKMKMAGSDWTNMNGVSISGRPVNPRDWKTWRVGDAVSYKDSEGMKGEGTITRAIGGNHPMLEASVHLFSGGVDLGVMKMGIDDPDNDFKYKG